MADNRAWQTTIMAASFDGGVVLGADSRTSTGNYIANRVTDKLMQLTDKVASSPNRQTCIDLRTSQYSLTHV